MPMEKDNRFKLRITQMFCSSFGSCRSRNISNVIEKAVFVPSQHLPPPSSPPKSRPFPSICRTTCPDPTRTVNNTCIVSARDVAHRSGSMMRPFPHVKGRFCPSSSPLSRTANFYEKTEKTKKRNAVKKKARKKNRRRSSSHDTNTTTLYDYYGGGDWFSSDDEWEAEEEEDDEIETLFSSRSTFSSDSSPTLLHRRRRRGTRRSKSTSRRNLITKKDDILPVDESEYKIKDSFAVVKRSSDPYSDFRTSMVEMIVERQIFGASELEKLLRCFLALNSVHHHGTIVEVFKEISDTLFSDLRQSGYN